MGAMADSTCYYPSGPNGLWCEEGVCVCKAARHLIVLLAAVALFPSCLRAQEEGLRDRDRALNATQRIASDLQKARLRYRNFYFLSRFDLADIGYDQPFFAPTGDQTAGLTLGISAPHRMYFVPSKKLVFSADAVPQYVFVDHSVDSTQHNQFGYALRGDAQLLLNHLFLDLYAAQSNQLRANTGEINRLLTQRTHEYGTNGEFKYSSRTSATFSGVVRDIDFPTGRLQPADIPVYALSRREETVRGSLVHKTFPLTRLFLTAESSRYKFVTATTKDSTRNYAGVGALRDSGVMTVRVEAGVTSLDFKNTTRHDYSGLVGNFDITRRPTNRWTYGLTGARDLDFSIFANNDYYITDRLAGTVEYEATRDLILRLSLQHGRDLYDLPAFAANGMFLKRRDDIDYDAIGFIYTFLHRVRAGVDVGYYNRTSNFVEESNNGIRLVLHLSFTP